MYSDRRNPVTSVTVHIFEPVPHTISKCCHKMQRLSDEHSEKARTRIEIMYMLSKVDHDVKL